LIHSLYDAHPNQCTTCGIRFPSTATGRSAKATHLDGHFRTNQRIADASNASHTRSWYIDELAWITLHDDLLSSSTDPSDPSNTTSSNNPNARNGAGGKAPARKYIPAPSGADSIRNATCPICQEKFETVWYDEAQEWAWMDAIRIGGSGGRIYHATCHAEVSQAAGSTSTSISGAGDEKNSLAAGDGASVLGKRKAETETGGAKNRLKREEVAA
jgi:pre-mRNA cleavage complex 2 protein Pcf11